MSFDIAIKVENLSKCYQIYGKPSDRLKQMLMRGRKQYYREFWALQDVSFEVHKGETVGIIGRNGSGKSTLLQLICGTLHPTSGRIQTNGRIAALLELGSGFNPEFTGRENVHLSATVLGLSEDEINARFDDIVAFADIGEFLEQPVKTYSSGMFVRLAFSVNIMSQPEIMVVDEALAVGDMAFQAKCMTALRRIQDQGATVLFVSHDTSSIKSLCTYAVFLEKGQLKKFGKAAVIAEEYVRVIREEINSQNQSRPSNSSCQTPSRLEFREVLDKMLVDDFDRLVRQFRYGIGGARIIYAELVDMQDQPVISAEFNQKLKVKIYFDTEIEADISVNYYIQDDKKNPILGAGLRTVGQPLLRCSINGRYVATYTTTLPLQEGNYSIHLEITKPIVVDQSAEFLDVIDDAVVFSVRRRIPGRVWAKAYIKNDLEIVQLKKCII